MQDYFEAFIKNISLSKSERDDAITKYKGICKCLNKEFYDSEYSDSVKFLFGSYKKKTTISHPDKDVDIIFKIPKEKFSEYQSQKNGPSNLLTKIKNTLKNTYSTTDNIKNWTKVVLVDFQSYKVEILPALEQENGKFTIPNTGDGEDWIMDFDPKKEVNDFYDSNNSNKKLTRKLIKIIKKWKMECSTVDIKTYILDSYAIEFLDGYLFKSYPEMIFDFFKYLKDKEPHSYVITALNRAGSALNYYNNGNIHKATKEYSKIFGDSFKTVSSHKALNTVYQEAPNEEFIENIALDDNYSVRIGCTVLQNGWRETPLNELPFLEKDKKLTFFIENHNIEEPFNIKWKVRNFGQEAESKKDLRGEITSDTGKRRKTENTRYRGEHFVECYIIKDNICVAKDRLEVPVSKG